MKNPLSLAKTRMASKSSTKQDEESTTEEVSGSIVIYTEEEINTFNRDVNFQCFRLNTSFLSVLPPKR